MAGEENLQCVKVEKNLRRRGQEDKIAPGGGGMNFIKGSWEATRLRQARKKEA